MRGEAKCYSALYTVVEALKFHLLKLGIVVQCLSIIIELTAFSQKAQSCFHYLYALAPTKNMIPLENRDANGAAVQLKMLFSFQITLVGQREELGQRYCDTR